MVRQIIIGDIHGRDCWKDIIECNGFDNVRYIFLGDYVDTHENIGWKRQCENIEEIYDLKKKRKDSVVLLIGNHDLQYYDRQLFSCSGFNANTFKRVNLLYREMIKDKEMLPMFLDCNGNLFSHAGISNFWLKSWYKDATIEDIVFNESYKIMSLGFSYDGEKTNPYGDDVHQGCTWIRPNSLLSDPIKGYRQFVGHTPMNHILFQNNIYFCDTLPNEYVEISEDNNVSIRTI